MGHRGPYSERATSRGTKKCKVDLATREYPKPAKFCSSVKHAELCQTVKERNASPRGEDLGPEMQPCAQCLSLIRIAGGGENNSTVMMLMLCDMKDIHMLALLALKKSRIPYICYA